MKRLSFGLVATLGVSACGNDSVTNGTNPSTTTSTTTTVETSTTEKPVVSKDGGAVEVDAGERPAVTSGDAAVKPPQETDAVETVQVAVDASVVTKTDAGSVDTEDEGLPPLPPPCGGLCDDAQLCNLATDECVECLTDLDCGEGKECRTNACEAIVPCESSESCPEGLAVCHSQLDRCVECEIDLDCPEQSRCESRQCVTDRVDECAKGADPCSSGTVVQMKEKQVLDGHGDEFCSIPGFELNFQNGARGNADLPHSMTVRVAWSEDAFHLYAEVEDPEVVTNNEVDYLWSGDVVELFLAPGPAAELAGFFSGRVDGVQLLIAPPTTANPARAARLFWLPSEDNPSNYLQVREPLTSGFAARATETGYAVEARLPWSMFGPRTPDIKNGASIALDFGLSTANAQSIGNANDGREGAVTLYAGSTTDVNTCSGDQVPWCNSTTWCTATLRDKAPPAPEPTDAGAN
jgi:Cys-rich repeat protein